MKKTVRFSNTVQVYPMIKWQYAYRKARQGEWEQQARDRHRFNMRIERLSKIITPVLEKKIATIKT